jgi:glycosyltransferase involved in cell wall biosynthesis
VLSLPVSRFLKTKVISWGHFSYYFEQSSLYRKWILKYSVRCADYMVTINEENKKCYQQFLGRTKRIQTIYNPVEEVACNTIDSKEKWLISVGRLVPIKGIDYLAKVAVSVLRKNKDWKWLVIGDGEERTRLEKVISKYHLQDQLILKGRVDNVGEYLQKAQIFVLTSRSEGLPMCLLEAKMCGLPSVSFDIQTGPREIIKDGVNGYLVKPYDCVEMVNKISTLIQSEELRKDFAKNTKQDLEKFQMKQIIERWNGVLENLCD